MYADGEEARQRARRRQEVRTGYRGSQGPRGPPPPAGGFKRKREDEIEDSPHPLLAALFTLGDRQRPRGADPVLDEELDQFISSSMEALSKGLNRDLAQRPEEVCTLLLDCAAELSPKCAVYATLAGLINSEEPKFVEGLVARAAEGVSQALACADWTRFSCLLRFLAALVPANVLHPSAVIGQLRRMVNVALDVVKTGDMQDGGRLWQPYTDFLVTSALLAVPWGGPEMAESAPNDMQQLLAAARSYQQARPRQMQQALRPMPTLDPAAAEDLAALCDSGGAARLVDVLEALEDMQTKKGWQAISIQTYHQPFEAQLATGQPHSLPLIVIPSAPPGIPEFPSPMQTAAAVLQTYPPVGGLRMLGEAAEGGRAKIERIIAEQLILDTLHYFSSDRLECVRRLGRGLQLPYDVEPVLVETLLSQLLCLPHSPHPPVAYMALLGNCQEFLPAFSKPLSACVKMLYANVPAMDLEVARRFATWLAHHLTNFDCVWPWTKWSNVLSAPPSDPQRRVVEAALTHMSELEFRETVLQSLPEDFKPLLGPEPKVQPLEGPTEAAAGEATVPDGAAGQAQNGHAAPEAASVASRFGPQLLQKVRERVMSDDMRVWMEEQGIEAAVGGPVQAAQLVLHVALVAGIKSMTHMATALTRYQPLMASFLLRADDHAGEALVKTAMEVWSSSTQKALLALGHLLRLKLATPLHVVSWAFSQATSGEEAPSARALSQVWGALDATVRHLFVGREEARQEVSSAEEMLATSRSIAENAQRTLARVEAEAAAGPSFSANPNAANFVQQQAAMQEREALASVEGLEAGMAAKQAAVSAAEDAVQAHLLEIFRGFAGALTDTAVGAQQEETAEGPAIKTSWRTVLTGLLRAFARHHHVEAACTAKQVSAEIFSRDSGLSNDVVVIANESLHP
ncbi:hypothetical protein WJX74_008679 [Apatococcus lobatus]|uniref:MIF4G domain-containing protein n=1 Tax=Apatococcus lobatus TaxID=904363 RepID=A0AAW1QIN3_9CHLO